MCVLFEEKHFNRRVFKIQLMNRKKFVRRIELLIVKWVRKCHLHNYNSATSEAGIVLHTCTGTRNTLICVLYL